MFIQIIFKFVEPKILIENTGERAFLEIWKFLIFPRLNLKSDFGCIQKCDCE